MKGPFVSIIIPAYNAEKTILHSLDAVIAQDYSGPREVIVVDDGSTDGTHQILTKFFNIKVVRQSNAGPASARNAGARASQGDLLFFTDSDCLPEPNWVSVQVPYFSDHKISAVAGTYGIANPESLLARSIHREILFRHQHLMPEFPRVFGSYNFSIRKKVFKDVQGFNETFRFASGEDNDLSYKVIKRGGKIRFCNESVVRHFHTENLKKYLLEQYRHGFWRALMYKQHPDMMQGDDYTFWKDMAEVPVVLVTLISLPLLLFKIAFVFHAACFMLSLLYLTEIYFAFRMSAPLPETFFLANMMFLRAFFRTCGFSSGIFRFFVKK